MNPILMIDLGSTNTKVTAVDLDGEKLLGTAASYTTVQTDINDGLENALKKLEDKINVKSLPKSPNKYPSLSRMPKGRTPAFLISFIVILSSFL